MVWLMSKCHLKDGILFASAEYIVACRRYCSITSRAGEPDCGWFGGFFLFFFYFKNVSTIPHRGGGYLFTQAVCLFAS